MLTIGQVIRCSIYGRTEPCELLAIHQSGRTIDVERISDGRCYRVTGLPASPVRCQYCHEQPATGYVSAYRSHVCEDCYEEHHGPVCR